MSLNCTDHLIQEHRLILRAAYVLKAMATQAENGTIPASEDVEKLLSFFRRFEDDLHQGKEETVLFPALRTVDAAGSDGPLGQMIFEHHQERLLIAGLEGALQTRNPIDFADFGGRTAEMLSNHIYKEENILFDWIEKTIGKDVDARISEEMRQFDRQMNPESHDELLHTVNQLEWKYLGKAA